MAVTPIASGTGYRWKLPTQNLKAVGTTSREMVAAVSGKKFTATGLLVIPTAVTVGAGTIQPKVSLGVGSAHSGELYGGEGGITVTAENVDGVFDGHKAWIDALFSIERMSISSAGIWFNVETASDFTTFTADIYLFGFID